MKRFVMAVACLSLMILNGFSQSFNDRLGYVDVKKYALTLRVSDSSDVIHAKMGMQVNFKRTVDKLELDLDSYDETNGLGMVVDSVFQNNVAVDFMQEDNRLIITPKHPFPGVIYTYNIKYHGVPKNGLIIGSNIHGDRTFFGDNWPNRAHYWFPCIDHPSDKAMFESLVICPNHYQVVANGTKVEETNISDDLKAYHYSTKVPLPTKVMVVGIARFAVQQVGMSGSVPVTSWVYPQTKTDGFGDYENAINILNYFIELIGPYPYAKLANVQSKTMFGGMENAGNIFYYEKSVTGEKTVDKLMAHEIAHQWFGNSASEMDWAHVWLSEGFATYLTNMYIQDVKGEEAFQEQLMKDKERIIRFFERNPAPIVDKETKDYMKLLNANSYQKGGWVLHMLRRLIGDEYFKAGLKAYYQRYALKNATTEDFRDVMEIISGQELDTFFNQWLYGIGQPVIHTDWISTSEKLRLIIEQQQEIPFEFPLDIELTYKDGSTEIKTVDVFARSTPFSIDIQDEVTSVRLDPNNWLLYQNASE